MATEDMSASGIQSSGSSNGSSPTEPAALRADIDRTRESLSGTVDALYARLDVRRQAKEKVGRVGKSATTDTGRPRAEVVAGSVGVLLLLVALVRRRRR